MAFAPASMTCQAFSPLRAAIDLDDRVEPALVAQPPQRPDLGQHLRQELLSAKPGIDGHDQHDAAEFEHIFDLRQRRRRVQHHPGGLSEIADMRQGPVQMDRRARLAMDDQMVGAGAGEIVEVTLGLDDHQMDIDRLLRRLAHGLDDDRADRDVRHKAPVHDIDMDPVGSRPIDGAHLLGEPAEIGRQDRRGDDDRAAHSTWPRTPRPRSAGWAANASSSGAIAGRCATAAGRLPPGRRCPPGRFRAGRSCRSSTDRGSAAPPPTRLRPRRRG